MMRGYKRRENIAVASALQTEHYCWSNSIQSSERCNCCLCSRPTVLAAVAIAEVGRDRVTVVVCASFFRRRWLTRINQ
jgi:hypothetical protein